MADAGIDYEFNQVMPEESLAELGLKLESQHPDMVIVDNGIRGTMELMHFMEQIIDVVRTHAPQAKLRATLCRTILSMPRNGGCRLLLLPSQNE
ncbi:unnamed protein product [Calypogeia fissa]